MRVTALATPGHTYTRLAYALDDAPAGGDAAAVGCSPAAHCSSARPAGPTCSGPSTPTSSRATSMPPRGGSPRCCPTRPRSSPPTVRLVLLRDAFRRDLLDDRAGEGRESGADPGRGDRHVDELLAGLGAWPAYYAHMAPANAAGPAPPTCPPRSSPTPSSCGTHRGGGVGRRPAQPHRLRRGHTPGTLNFGLDGSFATYLGWLVAWGTPLTLLGASADDVAQAQRELVRIGVDGPPRTPPAGHELDDRGAALDPDRHLRRPRPGPPPPRGDRARRAPDRRARSARTSSRRSTCRCTSSPPASRTCRAARSGCTAPVATGLGRRLVPGRRRPLRGGRRRLLRQRPPRRPARGRRGARVTLVVAAGRRRAHRTQPGRARRAAAPSSRCRCWSTSSARAPAQATTGSLVVVGVTSLIGAVTAYRAGNVMLGRGVAFGLVAIGGAVVGAQASAHVARTGAAGGVRRPDARRRHA